MLEFRGRHWRLPSNVDWHEGTILKRCSNICENNQTKFEPHASCMYFGSISSYVNGSKACKIASKIPWRWEIPITWFDIMVKDIWNVSWQFTKNAKECKHRLGDTSQSRLGICHHLVRKNKGNLVTHTSKWGTMFYLLFPIWTKKCMDFGHLPTHVPSGMPNHFDGGKGRDVHNVGPHFISAYMNNSIFEWPCHNIGSTIGLTHHTQ